MRTCSLHVQRIKNIELSEWTRCVSLPSDNARPTTKFDEFNEIFVAM
jgi:hypothetical protein